MVDRDSSNLVERRPAIGSIKAGSKVILGDQHLRWFPPAILLAEGWLPCSAVLVFWGVWGEALPRRLREKGLCHAR